MVLSCLGLHSGYRPASSRTCSVALRCETHWCEDTEIISDARSCAELTAPSKS